MRGQGRIGAPFCYQTLGALDAIRETFHGQRRYVALAIYVGLTELANEYREQNPRRRGFRAERRVVADRAGTSPNTVSSYIEGLEGAGVLRVDRADGEAYEWELIEPRGVTVAGTGSTSRRETPLPADMEGVSQETLEGVPGDVTPPGTDQASLRSKAEVEENISSSPPAHAREKDSREPKTVDSKPVTPEEHDLCDGILTAFNRRAGSDFRSPEYRRGIIGRIRERPEMGLPEHEALIDRTFGHPWWKDGNPSPAVIYGKSATFERCLNEKADPFQRHDLSAYDRGLEDDP